VARTLAGRLGWVVFSLLLLGLFLVAWNGDWLLDRLFQEPPINGPQLAWLVGLVSVSLGLLIAGTAINGRWSGVFIDSRNRYSLAQVQAVLWLIIISSGVVAAGVGNVVRGDSAPLDLQIPPELLAVIGLSVTTLVGSPIIRGIKRQNNPDPDQAARTLSGLGATRTDTSGPQVFGYGVEGATSPDVTTEGTVVTFMNPRQTGWADLLRGEETGNADKVDLGKLQLLYISAVAMLVYCAALFANLNPAPDAGGHATRLVFAGLDASFVGILGLSHAGALAYLAAPHSKTTD
jgi:hypothetical protein